jgi:CRP-like cAMP-binding protein
MNQTSYKNLKQYCYFSCLSDGALETVSNKFEIIKLPSGTLIIEEGTPADAFYMVCKGEVEVTKKNRWGQTATVSVAGHGESFGEMALLTCSPRFCSVTAKTDVSLLKLSKADFEEIVKADSAFAGLMVDRHQSFYRYNDIKTAQPFAHLQPEMMPALIGKLREKTIASGENIVTQGEKGDAYYIIKSGKADVFKKMMTDKIQKVAVIEEGQGFGEEALITDSPRSATVKAAGETTVWMLSKADFDSIAKSSFLEEVEPESILPGTENHINYLDVRMKMEFDEEHIPGAMNIPLDELRKRYAELDQSREYYIYCLLGARSASAAFLVNSQGFKAKSIKGGILNWPGPVEIANDGIHTPFRPT